MFFRLRFELPSLEIQHDPIADFGVSLDVGPATIRLNLADKEKFSWNCEVLCEHEPNDKVKAVFRALAEGSLDPRRDWSDDECPSRRLELLGPPPYRNLVDLMHEQLTEAASRFVSMMQWRLGLQGSHRPLRGGRRLWWSLDGKEWAAIPGVAGCVAGSAFVLRRVDERVHERLLATFEQGYAQPLGHELLREACQLRARGGERSAFVVAVMAAEVGVKQCIMELLPQTEWLLKSFQSPPLNKIVEDFLPTLPNRSDGPGPLFPAPKGLCDVIKKAVNIRNDIVHKGDHAKAAERLPQLIEAVRDLLYRLDVHRGHSWAINQVHWEDGRNDT